MTAHKQGVRDKGTGMRKGCEGAHVQGVRDEYEGSAQGITYEGEATSSDVL